MKRRKEIYEALYPETRNGATGRGRKKVCQIGEANLAARFTADTAAKTGMSERSVQRAVRQAEAIRPDVLASVANTPLDKGVVLERLASLPQEEQPAELERLRRNLTHAEPDLDDTFYHPQHLVWRVGVKIAPSCRFVDRSPGQRLGPRNWWILFYW